MHTQEGLKIVEPKLYKGRPFLSIYLQANHQTTTTLLGPTMCNQSIDYFGSLSTFNIPSHCGWATDKKSFPSLHNKRYNIMHSQRESTVCARLTSYKVSHFMPIYLQTNPDVHNCIVGELLAGSYHVQSTT